MSTIIVIAVYCSIYLAREAWREHQHRKELRQMHKAHAERIHGIAAECRAYVDRLPFAK